MLLLFFLRGSPVSSHSGLSEQPLGSKPEVCLPAYGVSLSFDGVSPLKIPDGC